MVPKTRSMVAGGLAVTALVSAGNAVAGAAPRHGQACASHRKHHRQTIKTGRSGADQPNHTKPPTGQATTSG
jgi:hypothetical protein